MLIPVNPVFPIVKKNGIMEQTFQAFVLQIANESMVVGTGSPEGVVEAQQSRLYMDDAGGTGSILYIKKQADISGDKSQGWILV